MQNGLKMIQLFSVIHFDSQMWRCLNRNGQNTDNAILHILPGYVVVGPHAMLRQEKERKIGQLSFILTQMRQTNCLRVDRSTHGISICLFVVDGCVGMAKGSYFLFCKIFCRYSM